MRSGYVYETRGKTEEAILVYEEAMRTNPDNPGFVERLGDLLIRLGRYKDAQARIEQLAEVAPRNTGSLAQAGRGLLRAEDVGSSE